MAYHTVTINNVRILPGVWSNFQGKVSQYNKEGARNFNIALEQEQAERMAADGFNVKFPKPRPDDISEDEDRRAPFLSVTVSNKHDIESISPYMKIILIDEGVETRLNIEDIGMLDNLDIDYADIQMNANEYDVNGRKGIKCYLYSLRVYLRSTSFGESDY